ncbi:MAG: hypothetical protein RH859_07540 [Longimicrobiales bacterium]
MLIGIAAAGWTVTGLTAQEAPITQLDWLIGSWTFDDEALAGEYRESGTRDCAYALGGDYIRCESTGVDHRGRERTYLWFFNYNQAEERFEITSLFQGYPAKTLYTATVHDGGRRLEVSFGTWEGDGIVVEGGATVTYDGADRYVWENARFRDVVTRR